MLAGVGSPAGWGASKLSSRGCPSPANARNLVWFLWSVAASGSEWLFSRLEDDLDDELYQNGSVIWAKVPGRPWWPCVVFKSWEDVQRWGVQTRQRGPLASHEVGASPRRLPA